MTIMEVDGTTRYKTAADRTAPEGLETTLADEYRVLERMHAAAPGRVPEPRGIEYGPDGAAERYGMEEISGTDLQELDYGALTDEEAEELAASIEDAVSRFHDAGIPHGDVCTSNVLVDDDMDPYLIDPAGIDGDHPDADAVMERDRQNAAYVADLVR